jgi:MoCo/4Fe-4S cofactor protein with predicted Tat translocation signal
MNPRKDLARRLEGAGGKKYWRTLEELAESEAFQELMRQEFPGQSGVWPSLPSRRQFLTLMGASLALAGITGCNVRPANSITMVPYVRAPEEIVPGKPLFYATSMTLGGASVGLLVESHMGRPTKIEGNPDHPASLGATDRFSQASILTMYDPDRSKEVTRLGQPVTWGEAVTALRQAMDRHRSRRGAGLRLLTETVVSPTLGDQLESFLKDLPDAKWHQYEPLAADNAHRAGKLGFGTPVNTYHRFYDLDKKQRTAEVILAIDADFLTCGPGNLRYVAEFAAGRRQRLAAGDPAKMKEEAQKAAMSRLYVVETELTPTGAKADHRLALRPRDVEAFARALAAELKVPGAPAAPAGLPEAARKWLPAVAKDLRSHGPGTSVVLAGDRQPVAVHLLVHAINEHLGNVGKTVLHTDPIQTRPVEQMASLRELAEALDGGDVETLLIFGSNAAFTAPRDLDFAARLEKFSKDPKHLSVHLGLYQDETARLCQWHLPEAYYLEAWGDGRAFDGTVSIVQPLIQPLYHGHSAHELLAVLANGVATPSYDLVRAYWRKHWEGKKQGKDKKAEGDKDKKAESDFEDFWETSVHDGKVADTAFTAKNDLRLKDGWQQHVESDAATRKQQTGDYDLVFQQDPTIYDGRFANNGWLQELPKPITRVAWDNAALVSPATAKELTGVTTGTYAHGGEHGGYHQPVIEIKVGDETVRAPVWAVPGHPDGTVTVHLGYGRKYAGRVGGDTTHPVGFNVYPLRTTRNPWWLPIDKPRVTTGTQQLACTQQHQLMENRNIVRSATLEEYKQTPWFAKQVDTEPGEGKKARHELAPPAPPVPPPPPHTVPPAARARVQVGHGHRPDGVRRLQGVRRRLPGGEQHPRRRQGPGAGRPRDALAAHRPLQHRTV